MTGLSDKAIAVFAFAAYHQMTAGETVADVVLADGTGHTADADAVTELETGDFVTVGNGRAAFTPKGQEALVKAVGALRASFG